MTQVQDAVAGIEDTNLNINCFSDEVPDPGYDGYFWKINGSVYGTVHLPKEYKVCQLKCNLATLTIPVVLAEMDGYTFQCFGINYQTSTVHEGRVTELNVISNITGEFLHWKLCMCMYIIIGTVFTAIYCTQ